MKLQRVLDGFDAACLDRCSGRRTAADHEDVKSTVRARRLRLDREFWTVCSRSLRSEDIGCFPDLATLTKGRVAKKRREIKITKDLGFFMSDEIDT